MKLGHNALAVSYYNLVFAELDNHVVFGTTKKTRQELIDMIQARSMWKDGYDKEWLEKVVDEAIEDWNRLS